MPHKMLRVMPFLLLAAATAVGQVDLRLAVENTTVLTHEKLPTSVTVLNNGVAPLVLNAPGGAGPRLRFSVDDDSGRPVARRQGAAWPTLTIGPGQVQALEVDLTMHFVMSKPGRYFVRAQLQGRGAEARSSLKVIDVVPGMELVKATGSVPRAPGVRRTYALRYWSRKQNDHVFLCVSDAPSGRVFAPVYLGTLLRVVRPTLAVGDDGTVTVTHQVNRSQMMVSKLTSRRDKLSLVSQHPVRMASSAKPKPATLPRP